MNTYITDEQIDDATKDIGLQSPFARYRIARAVLALAAQQEEPLGYIPTDAIDQIKGTSRIFTYKVPVLSYAAEGYTAIYTAPAPAPAVPEDVARTLICPKCNADRFKGDCKGDPHTCPVRGEAWSQPPKED